MADWAKEYKLWRLPSYCFGTGREHQLNLRCGLFGVSDRKWMSGSAWCRHHPPRGTIARSRRLPTGRKSTNSGGSPRIVSGLAENTNSIFGADSSESQTANGCPVLPGAGTTRREALLPGPADCRLGERVQTLEAPLVLFRDWQRTPTQSSVRTLRSLRPQMDVRFCMVQEPPAERHYCQVPPIADWAKEYKLWRLPSYCFGTGR